MKHKKSVTIVCACMFLLALIGFAWHLHSRHGDSLGLIQRVVLFLSEDTAYGPGYSERTFRKIAMGDTEARVREALGVPLDERDDKPYVRWLYAPDRSLEFEKNGSYPDMRFSFTTIDFGEDRNFVDAFGQLSGGSRTTLLGASSSSSFGDGVNTLSLTRAAIEQLKADKATPEQIEAKFGKPRARFESRVTKWLQYSHSPGSNNYRQRLIGFDAKGQVCRKVDDVYWD